MKDLCLAEQAKLFALVAQENERQIVKWGIEDRSPFEWLTYATEELGELAQVIGEHEYRKGTAEAVVKEAIQTATLVLKIAEMYLAVDTNCMKGFEHGRPIDPHCDKEEK